MKESQQRTDILIVGAGMAGLAAAAELQSAGHKVLVIDKGRGVGGRLATRRIGEATFDHGAQFMTAKEPRFQDAIQEWRRQGALEEWYRNTGEGSDPRPRWRGKPAMTGVAKHLARELDLRLGERVALVRRDQDGWVAALEGGEEISARALLLTPPVPQSLALLEAGDVELPQSTITRLEEVEYERCFAIMALLDGPSRIPQPGGLAPSGGPIAWIADNQMKGVSALPAVTIHATAEFSLDCWGRDRRETGRELLRAAESWLGSTVVEFQVHGWRYSKPLRIDREPCLTLNGQPPLVIAGDAFAGPRVEGAVLSGWAAADVLRM